MRRLIQSQLADHATRQRIAYRDLGEALLSQASNLAVLGRLRVGCENCQSQTAIQLNNRGLEKITERRIR